MTAEPIDFESIKKILAPVDDADNRASIISRALEYSVTPLSELDQVGMSFDGFRLNDEGNARRLVVLCRDMAWYVDEWGKWIVYDLEDGVWKHDPNKVRMLWWVRQTLIDFLENAGIWYDGAGKSKGLSEQSWDYRNSCNTERASEVYEQAKKHAKAWGKSDRLNATIQVARSFTRLQCDIDQFDADPDALNLRDCSISLRTGNVVPHDPAYMFTKQAPVGDPRGKSSEVWQRCLNEWQPEPEMQAYLQEIVGSALTGHAVQHLFINTGVGSNGKSVFWNRIMQVLGDQYAVIPHKSLLIQQRNQEHPTALASLHGARLLVAPEVTDEYSRLSEDSVKTLTGGDVLRARRMREDEWSFRPTHTLVMHVNHEPRISGTDNGIWRRIRYIPWEQVITDPDPRLATNEFWESELPGILNWALQGAIRWLGNDKKFTEPEKVIAATKQFRDEQNPIGKFFDERCVEGSAMITTKDDLYIAYEAWCIAHTQLSLSKKAFGMYTAGRGYRDTKVSGVRAWAGISLAE